MKNWSNMVNCIVVVFSNCSDMKRPLSALIHSRGPASLLVCRIFFYPDSENTYHIPNSTFKDFHCSIVSLTLKHPRTCSWVLSSRRGNWEYQKCHVSSNTYFINHNENSLHIETKVCCPNTTTLLKYKMVRNSDARNLYIFTHTLVFLSSESWNPKCQWT